MENNQTLMATYLIEMMKACNAEAMTKEELKETKVVVTVVFKTEGEDVVKQLEGKTGTIVKGLKVLDMHTNDLNRTVYIKKIELVKGVYHV